MNGENLEAYYGLPQDVRFCMRCVISNQRPNSCVEFANSPGTPKKTICFGDDGVCDACRTAERKQSTDWAEKAAALRELCDRHRRHDGRYDCIVPGSGGKDSFYAAWTLKHEYGMHPLTVTWAPHLHTDWGWHNFHAWIHAGFDNYLHTPNGRIHRLLTRLAVERLFHPFQPFMLGQKIIAPKLAATLDVPLVFYGENEAEYGNPISDNDTPMRDFSYFSETDPDKVFFSGTSVTELKERFGLTLNDLAPYMPIDPQLLEDKKVQVHYLGYYLPWHPQRNYYVAVEHGDFHASPERTPGTYSKYNSIDDKIDDLHYYTTFIKFGIGRATYDASQEIRSGDITREEGVALVHQFDGEWPSRFQGELFTYLSMDERSYPKLKGAFSHPTMTYCHFMELADKFRSPHLWESTSGGWKLRHVVS